MMSKDNNEQGAQYSFFTRCILVSGFWFTLGILFILPGPISLYCNILVPRELSLRILKSQLTAISRVAFTVDVLKKPCVWGISVLNRDLLGSKKIEQWDETKLGKNENTETYRRLAVGKCQREECLDNIRRIKLAMEVYYAEYGEVVPAYTTNESGEPLHSWRVLLLPYLGYRRLYEKIRLEEPWNSEWNSQFNLVPDCYCCPAQRRIGSDPPCDKSCYSAVLRKTDSDDAGKTYQSIETTDGKRITIMERSPQYSWMDPEPEHELPVERVLDNDYFETTNYSNHADRTIWVLGDLPFLVSSESNATHSFLRSPRKFREEFGAVGGDSLNN